MDTSRIKCEYSLIFSVEDIKRDFNACVVKAINECDEAVILAENSTGGIRRIAKISYNPAYRESCDEWQIEIERDLAENFGINSKTTEAFLNLAMLVKYKTAMGIDAALEIANAITEKFDVSQK